MSSETKPHISPVNGGTLLSRRELIKLTTAAAATAVFPLSRAEAMTPRKTLRIAQWKHFVPEFDAWFDHELTAEWGARNGTKVIVDHFPLDELKHRADEEVKAGSGHDLFMFPSPPATYEPHVINHNEIYAAVGRKHGSVCPLGHKSTFNPVTRNYFAFAESFVPAPLLYAEDYWKRIDIPLGPTSYAELLEGAIDIRKRFGIPCGIPLTESLESNMAWHAVLSTFGANIQDERGNVTINCDKRTAYAMQYAASIYDLAGAPSMIGGAPGSSVEAMLSHKASCMIHSIGLIRKAEREKPDLAAAIQIRPALRTPHRQVGYAHVTSCYVIWTFARNPEGAKQFAADLVDSAETAFQKSRYCNFSCFPRMIPDLIKYLQNDPSANPPFKYLQLEDALFWTQNLGYPGYATAGFCEVFNSFLVPKLFGRVATGKITAEDGAKELEASVKAIYARLG